MTSGLKPFKRFNVKRTLYFIESCLVIYLTFRPVFTNSDLSTNFKYELKVALKKFTL